MKNLLTALFFLVYLVVGFYQQPPALTRGQAERLFDLRYPKILAFRSSAPMSRMRSHASPPTVTTNATATITGQAIYPDSALLRLGGNQTMYSGAGTALTSKTLGGGTQVSPYSIEFMFDGQSIEIEEAGSTPSMRLIADGQIAYESYGGSTVGRQFRKYDFGSRAVRRLRFELVRYSFYSFRIANPDTIYPVVDARRPRCLILGDSYTSGTITSGSSADSLRSWGWTLCEMLGWDFLMSGIATTGYLNPGGSQNFATRLAADVIQNANVPDVIIVAGGFNDTVNSNAAYTPAALEAAAVSLHRTIRAYFPNTLVFAIGPWSTPSTANNTGTANADAALRTACATARVPYISPRNGTVYAADGSLVRSGAKWVTGSGSPSPNESQPNGTGNADYYMGSDNTHPSIAGHVFNGWRAASDVLLVWGANLPLAVSAAARPRFAFWA